MAAKCLLVTDESFPVNTDLTSSWVLLFVLKHVLGFAIVRTLPPWLQTVAVDKGGQDVFMSDTRGRIERYCKPWNTFLSVQFVNTDVDEQFYTILLSVLLLLLFSLPSIIFFFFNIALSAIHVSLMMEKVIIENNNKNEPLFFK